MRKCIFLLQYFSTQPGDLSAKARVHLLHFAASGHCGCHLRKAQCQTSVLIGPTGSSRKLIFQAMGGSSCCSFPTVGEVRIFPTCQVRVVRFYHSSCPPPPPPPPHRLAACNASLPISTASDLSQTSNCAPERSEPYRAATACQKECQAEGQGVPD